MMVEAPCGGRGEILIPTATITVAGFGRIACSAPCGDMSLCWTSVGSCSLYQDLLFGTGRADVSAHDAWQRQCRRQASHFLKTDNPFVPVFLFPSIRNARGDVRNAYSDRKEETP